MEYWKLGGHWKFGGILKTRATLGTREHKRQGALGRHQGGHQETMGTLGTVRILELRAERELVEYWKLRGH